MHRWETARREMSRRDMITLEYDESQSVKGGSDLRQAMDSRRQEQAHKRTDDDPPSLGCTTWIGADEISSLRLFLQYFFSPQAAN